LSHLAPIPSGCFSHSLTFVWIHPSVTPLRLLIDKNFIFPNSPPHLPGEPSTTKKMPVTASKAARMAKKAEKGETKKTAASRLSSKAGSKNASRNGSKASSVAGDETPPMLDGDDSDAPATTQEQLEKVKKLTEGMDKHGISDRVTTGVLASQETSRDVRITSASLVFHGKVLITDSTLEINFGRRYGLLGENGCGKSTLLKAIEKREYPFPDQVDIYLLNEGAPPTDQGALEWVIKEAEKEVQRLDDLAEEILERDGPESPALMDIYEVKPQSHPTQVSLY
jgi:ATP-binding cassette, subfamily F, member 2